MKKTDLTTLKIHRLTNEQYEAALAAGTVNENEIYTTPDENAEITDAEKSSYDSHIINPDIHVTTNEKSTWNAKQNKIIAGHNIEINNNTINSIDELPTANIGAVWERSNKNVTSYSSTRLCYGNNKWVSTKGGLCYSEDNGMTWTNSIINSEYDWVINSSSLTFFNNLFIVSAFRYDYNYEPSVIFGDILYSSDGVTWNEAGLFQQSEIKYIANNDNTIIVTCSTGTGMYGDETHGTVYRSSNGINYIDITPSFLYDSGTNYQFEKIFFENNIWYTNCSDSNVYYSIDNGDNWNNLSVGYIYGMCFINNMFIASFGGAGIYYSNDGLNWNQSNITNGYYYRMSYNNGMWIACGSGIRYSTDGISWVQSNINNITISTILYANDMWLAGIYYSYDGMNWIKSNISAASVDDIKSNKDTVLLTSNTYIYYLLPNDNNKVLTVNFDGTKSWKTSQIPSNISAFNNDAGYLTQHQDISGLASKPTVTTTTLLASNWDSTAKTYSFESDYPSASYDVEIEIDGDNCTDEQLEAWIAAKPLSSSTNKINAKGDVPSVDIPIILTVAPK